MHFIASLFASVFTLVGLVVTGAAMIFAFMAARTFVLNRLRYVDAVKSPVAPWLAGLVATIVLIPVVGLLSIVHLVAGGTALLIGASTGVGTASGVKALKRGE